MPSAAASDTLAGMLRLAPTVPSALRVPLAALVLAVGLSGASPTAAQGLLWSLPEDGTAAIYAGSYSQVIRRTGSTQQDVELTFNRELRVRSVGTQPIEYGGEQTTGRWIEFEAITRSGEAVAGDDGDVPGRTTIVKLLVPEPFVDGQARDARDIPKTAIPYVKGYVLRDRDEVVELPPNGTYQPFPELTLLRMSRPLAQDGQRIEAEETIESRTARSELKTELNRDPSAPFGLAGWTVTTKDSRKEFSEPRDSFRETSESTETMELSRVEQGAVSAIDRE